MPTAPTSRNNNIQARREGAGTCQGGCRLFGRVSPRFLPRAVSRLSSLRAGHHAGVASGSRSWARGVGRLPGSPAEPTAQAPGQALPSHRQQSSGAPSDTATPTWSERVVREELVTAFQEVSRGPEAAGPPCHPAAGSPVGGADA